ncbi:MAG: hypothetical protein FalmKO_01830 [Falsiruegeria mediterranea]
MLPEPGRRWEQAPGPLRTEQAGYAFALSLLPLRDYIRAKFPDNGNLPWIAKVPVSGGGEDVF